MVQKKNRLDISLYHHSEWNLTASNSLLAAWLKMAWISTSVLYYAIFKARVKPGFIGRQGSADRSFYVSFTALPTDTCSKRSYPIVFATNLLSDTALKICIAHVIKLCSNWIKASSEKHALF